jgi:hypothetical protein
MSVSSLVFQGCSIHRGHNVKNCIGCVDDSLHRLAEAVQVVVNVMEERHGASVEALKDIQTALGEVKPDAD